MKNRIIGIDVARALAIIGMIIVNFKLVFDYEGSGWLTKVAGVFDGKAAATFVVLAGVGMALMSNLALRNNDLPKLKRTYLRIVKRALFLFIIGLSYIFIWPADILHFYGIYMLVVLVFLKTSSSKLLGVAAVIIISFPVMMPFWNYELGWNFDTIEYQDFWSANGFFRNLFYNGFHPVLPWSAFMIIGLWYGRQNLNNDQFVKKSFLWSLLIFILTQLMSMILIASLKGNSSVNSEELNAILGTGPMPPLPIYMISGSAIALTIISGCILLAKKYENNSIVKAFHQTGQLALTFYVAHVVLGMGIVDAFFPNQLGGFSLEFSVTYALVFSTL